MTEVSTGAVEGLNPDDFRNCKIHELNISLDRNKTEVDTQYYCLQRAGKMFQSLFTCFIYRRG